MRGLGSENVIPVENWSRHGVCLGWFFINWSDQKCHFCIFVEDTIVVIHNTFWASLIFTVTFKSRTFESVTFESITFKSDNLRVVIPWKMYQGSEVQQVQIFFSIQKCHFFRFSNLLVNHYWCQPQHFLKILWNFQKWHFWKYHKLCSIRS